MIAITKGMIALSALVSAGFMTAYDTVTGGQNPSGIIAARFPAATETFGAPAANKAAPEAPAVIVKGDRLPMNAGCAEQQWPYITSSCLVALNGAAPRVVARTVTVERQVNQNTSELARVPVTSLASR